MKRKGIGLALLCAVLILTMAGCTQVSEERGMPGLGQATAVPTATLPPVETAEPTAIPATAAPTPDIPEGENAPDQPGFNG